MPWRARLALLLCVGLGACGLWRGDEAKDELGEAPVEGPRFAYRTEIRGVDDAGLRDILTQTSRLATLQQRPPATLAGLRQRAEEDVPRLEQALRSEGYYASRVAVRVEGDAPPAAAVVEVVPGRAYSLAAYDVRYVGGTPAPAGGAADPSALGIERGKTARAPAIVAAEQALVARLAEEGRPKARIADRRVTVDHAAATTSVAVEVDPGPPARFGPVAIEGLAQVKEDHVRKLVPWKQGDPFDQRKVDALRATLGKSSLFDSASITQAEAVAADGTLPMTLRLAERPHRSIGGGVSYSTGEGLAVEAFWEHRNLFGRQEQLKITGIVSTIQQSLITDFRKPHYLRLDQSLLANVTARAQDTDAYKERTIATSVGLERELSPIWRAAAGVSLEQTALEDDSGDRQFTLAGLPMSVRRDDTDNLLDPTRGTRLRLDLTPYAGTGDETLLFLRTELGGSAYFRLTGDDRLVLAARAKIGSIVGENTATLPATKRFYAGGGGSIRGFEFQRVGPLDADNDPLGGRSLIELGTELRYRVTETIGIVPFIDAGNVYDSSLPDFSEALRVAAGLGFRYFTAVGPLRLDIAFPLNRREDVDDLFQFYISLGQAF